MIEITIGDTDIAYPLKELSVKAEQEGMTLSEKMKFIDESVDELKNDLRAMLDGTASVYDDYYDREVETDIEKTEIA